MHNVRGMSPLATASFGVLHLQTHLFAGIQEDMGQGIYRLISSRSEIDSNSTVKLNGEWWYLYLTPLIKRSRRVFIFSLTAFMTVRGRMQMNSLLFVPFFLRGFGEGGKENRGWVGDANDVKLASLLPWLSLIWNFHMMARMSNIICYPLALFAIENPSRERSD